VCKPVPPDKWVWENKFLMLMWRFYKQTICFAGVWC